MFKGALEKYGLAIAVSLAVCAGVPALWLPFLSDDWVNLAATTHGFPTLTAFHYFRPLYLGSYWLEQRLWGPAPLLFHGMNLLLAGLVAGLAVIVLRRYTTSVLAASAACLAAVHPYHVENVAWIAARSDLLYAVFFLLALVAYDSWRTGCRGIPLVAMLLFEASLLCKEAALSLPALLVLIALVDPRRRAGSAEWRRGLLPMIGVAALHFGIAWSVITGALWSTVPTSLGLESVKRILRFGVASLVPVHSEILETHPFFWGALALVLLVGFVLAAWLTARRIPALAWVGVAAWLVLLIPSLVSFQHRYLLLPSIASGLAIAAVLDAAPRRVRALGCAVLLAGWMATLPGHWQGWRVAGQTSSRLMRALVEESRRADVEEIVVANMPHRVRGNPVVTDFTSAVPVAGGRSIRVRSALYVDYAEAGDSALDGEETSAVRRSAPFAEVRLRPKEIAFSRTVIPRFQSPRDYAAIFFDADGSVRVRILPSIDGRRAAYFWTGGELKSLSSVAR